MSDVIWTAEEDVELIRLLALLIYSYADIAARLTAQFKRPISRNAVTSRIRRLEKNGPQLVRNRADLKEFSPRKKSQPRVALNRSTKPEPAVAVSVSLPKRKRKLCTLDDLRKGICHWPSGDQPPYLYCGAVTEKGSYCAEHSKIAYSKPKKRDPSSERPFYRRH